MLNKNDLLFRKEEMIRMRFSEGKTNTEIGNYFGISRERVRQIIGNTGRYFRRNWTRELIKSGEVSFSHYTQLCNAPGVRREWEMDWGNHRHTAKSGFVRVGQEFEEMASVILARNGVSNMLMPNRCKYNIECGNGARVEVVTSTFDVSKVESQEKVLYPTFAVPIRRVDFWDFLFVFIPDEYNQYTYYVIPAQSLYHFSGIKGARIRIPHPPMSQKASKWHEYHKRIDLIKKYTV